MKPYNFIIDITLAIISPTKIEMPYSHNQPTNQTPNQIYNKAFSFGLNALILIHRHTLTHTITLAWLISYYTFVFMGNVMWLFLNNGIRKKYVFLVVEVPLIFTTEWRECSALWHVWKFGLILITRFDIDASIL